MNLRFSQNRCDKLFSTAKHKVGSWCVFVPIDKTSGIKFYHSKKMRDASMAGQVLAAKHNLGPRVGSRVSLNKIDTRFFMKGKRKPHRCQRYDYLYGYVTELVSTASNGRVKERDSLLDNLSTLGFRTMDILSFNLGRRKDGTLVCIDFDAVFTYNTKLKNICKTNRNY